MIPVPQPVEEVQPERTSAYKKALAAYETDNGKRALQMTKLAEVGPKGAYNTMFGGGTFDSYDRHPNRVVKTKNYASAAAGLYQFMPDTWNAIAKVLGLKDFSPKSQDIAAIYLMQQRGVDPSKPMTNQMIDKMSREWASFPMLGGGSYYGQPSKTHAEMMNYYNSPLKTAPGQPSTTEAAETLSKHLTKKYGVKPEPLVMPTISKPKPKQESKNLLELLGIGGR